MAPWLIILGVVLVLTGRLWHWLGELGLGRLRGDLVLEHDHSRLDLPITTSILFSLALPLILWLNH